MKPLQVFRSSRHGIPGRGIAAKPTIGLIAMFFLCSVPTAWHSPGQSVWTRAYPERVSPDLNAVTYGNGLIVAVGNNGAVSTSSDGRKWTSGLVAPDVLLTGVTYGDAGFAVVGLHQTSISLSSDWAGVIYTSSDAITWTPRMVNPDYGPRGIAYGNGRYVTSGRIGLSGFNQPSPIWTSIDGIVWTENTNSMPALALRFASGSFMAVAGSKLWTSLDGSEWDEADIPDVTGSYGLYAVTKHQDRWVAVGDDGHVHTSSDGKLWTRADLTVSESLWDVTWANGRFVVVGSSGLIVTSEDGRIWNTEGSVSDAFLSGTTGYDGGFVAVGRGGTLLQSVDGVQWMVAGATAGPGLNAVAFGDAGFVAVGNAGTILLSSDTMQWRPQTSFCTNDLLSVCFSGAHYAAVGMGGAILRSRDGVLWERTRSDLTNDFSDVTATPEGFTAVSSSGSTIESPDGVTWSVRDTWTNIVLATVATGASGEVILGGERPSVEGEFSSGFVSLRTLNSGPWAIRTLTNHFRPADLCYAAGLYVGVGSVGFGTIGSPRSAIMVSSNGLDWIEATTLLCFEALNGVAHGNGCFVGVGSGVALSDEGKSWRIATTANPSDASFLKRLSGVAYGKGRYVAVGNQMANGVDSFEAPMVWVSEAQLRLATPEFDQGGHMRFLVVGPPGKWAELQASVDLSHWEPILALEIPENGVSVLDPASSRQGARFYRAVLRP